MMRTSLSEEAGFVCPSCRKPGPSGMEFGLLKLQPAERESNGWLVTGSLRCEKCGAEYPIVDGVPCVLRDVEGWLSQELAVAEEKPELPKRWRGLRPAQSQSGRTPASERGLRDSYAEYHYGHLSGARENLTYWRAAVDSANSPEGAVLDMGCSVGRFSSEMAAKAMLAVGLDIRLEPLRFAARLQREGRARYARRVGGRGSEVVELAHSIPRNVLFVAGDALDPPFAAGTFDTVAALNLLDNVPYPLVLLGQMDALLRTGGTLVIGTPYEWREDVCHPSEWLEAEGMSPDETLRRTLKGEMFPEAKLAYDIELDLQRVGWSMRVHDRHSSRFESHVVRARKKA